MNDGPEKLKFIPRRISANREELIPRRRSDAELFKILTGSEETALNLIDEGASYQEGMPLARMRFSDVPPGGDLELTPRQMQVYFDFKDWFKETPERPKRAVMMYTTGTRKRMIERNLRIRNGDWKLYVRRGLRFYCLMKGWEERKALMTFTGDRPSKLIPDEMEEA